MLQDQFPATSKKVRAAVILAGIALVLGAFLVLSAAVANITTPQAAEVKESSNGRNNLAHPPTRAPITIGESRSLLPSSSSPTS